MIPHLQSRSLGRGVSPLQPYSSKVADRYQTAIKPDSIPAQFRLNSDSIPAFVGIEWDLSGNWVGFDATQIRRWYDASVWHLCGRKRRRITPPSTIWNDFFIYDEKKLYLCILINKTLTNTIN